jgi:hypothetical protein
MCQAIRWVSVAQPRDTNVAGVRAGRESERARCPFPGAAQLCACHGLCRVAIVVSVSATGSQSLGAVLNPEQHPPCHEKTRWLDRIRTRMVGTMGISFQLMSRPTMRQTAQRLCLDRQFVSSSENRALARRRFDIG